MSSLQATLFSSTGEASGKFDLPASLTEASGSRRVLHEAIVAFNANRRRGTSSTKTRGLVRGGGRKPWKQKGTGNARAGSIRSPLWRGGGIIFGPLPRSYRVGLDAAKRAIALQTAIVELVKSSALNVIDSFKISGQKTSEASEIFKKTGIQGRTLLVVDKRESSHHRVFRNLRDVTLLEASEVNAGHLLKAKHVLVTKSAFDVLVNRLPKE